MSVKLYVQKKNKFARFNLLIFIASLRLFYNFETLHNCLRRISAKLSRPYLSSAKVFTSRSHGIFVINVRFNAKEQFFFLKKLFHSCGSFYRGDDYFTNYDVARHFNSKIHHINTLGALNYELFAFASSHTHTYKKKKRFLSYIFYGLLTTLYNCIV